MVVYTGLRENSTDILEREKALKSLMILDPWKDVYLMLILSD